MVKRLHLVAEVFANAIARKRADETLRESEGRLKLATDAAGAGLWIMDQDGSLWARTSQPFESVTPRSTIPPVKRDFNGGRTGRPARRIESTRSCQEASERFKTTIEARQPRLILGGAGG
jgi:hypothetical protein